MGWFRNLLVTLTSFVLIGSLYLPAPSASAATVNLAVQSAASYASQHGVRVGISVIDLRTGRMYTSGYSTSRFPSASVVKVYMATYLLRTGKMSGYNEQQAHIMITQSNNHAFEYLLGKYFNGSAARLFTWMQDHYAFGRMGGPPSSSKSWCWGNTHITARGMTHFYAKAMADPKVGPWLSRAMHHYVAEVDGFNQAFGIPHASPTAGIKQGWSDGCSPEYPYHTVLNSTGVVNGRYAVAILTESRGSISYDRKIINHIAGLIMPNGQVSLPATR